MFPEITYRNQSHSTHVSIGTLSLSLSGNVAEGTEAAVSESVMFGLGSPTAVVSQLQILPVHFEILLSLAQSDVVSFWRGLEIADITTNRRGKIVFDRLIRENRGERIFQVVFCCFRSGDSKIGVTVIDTTAVCDVSVGQQNSCFGSHRYLSSLN